MEEDIKILEKFTKIVKGKDYDAKNGWHGYYDDELIVLGKSIENLIKGYRELEKYYEEQNEVNAKYIPKSKVKEKIEEYQANMKLYEQHLSNIFHENDIRQEVITVLTDLLREENNESKL